MTDTLTFTFNVPYDPSEPSEPTYIHTETTMRLAESLRLDEGMLLVLMLQNWQGPSDDAKAEDTDARIEPEYTNIPDVWLDRCFKSWDVDTAIRFWTIRHTLWRDKKKCSSTVKVLSLELGKSISKINKSLKAQKRRRLLLVERGDTPGEIWLALPEIIALTPSPLVQSPQKR